MYKKQILLLIIYYLVKFVIYAINQNAYLNTVTFIDVGQGDSIFIKSRSGISVLVDGGSGYTLDSFLGQFYPFEMCPTDILVLTHPHKDHLEGLLRLLYRCKDSQVYYNPINYPSNLYSDFVSVSSSYRVDTLVKEDVLIVDNLTFYAIWPPVEMPYFSNVNDTSITLLLDVQNYEALFTGDLGSKFFSNLSLRAISGLTDGKFDLVKISHHGAKNGLNETFYNMLLPKECVISVGENKYGHPSVDLLSFLQGLSCNVRRTDLENTITVPIQ